MCFFLFLTLSRVRKWLLLVHIRRPCMTSLSVSETKYVLAMRCGRRSVDRDWPLGAPVGHHTIYLIMVNNHGEFHGEIIRTHCDMSVRRLDAWPDCRLFSHWFPERPRPVYAIRIRFDRHIHISCMFRQLILQPFNRFSSGFYLLFVTPRYRLYKLYNMDS